MFGVMETKDNNKKTYCYLTDIEDIKEFYEKKVKEFALKGFTLGNVRKFKIGKMAGVVKYFNFRKNTQIGKIIYYHYYSYSIYKISNNKIIENYQINDKEFSFVYNKSKRIKNQVFRLSEDEIFILKELANKYKVKPADIIRASILECFKKDIGKIKRKLND